MLNIFFSQYPVFRYEELRNYLNQERAYKESTLKALLQYHLHKKHVVRIRRGYYATTIAEDYILIAGRVTQDAVIAYHSALSFHGIGYSIDNHAFFFTTAPMQAFTFNGIIYQAITHPKLFDETTVYDRHGLDIRATSVERTLVDCLTKPQFAGGFEEIWHAIQMINFLDVERMVDYALKINNATTIAKLGFLLEQHQAQFEVSEKILNRLQKNKPKGIHYMMQGSSGSQYIKRWNLMVPRYIKNKAWEEPEHDI